MHTDIWYDVALRSLVESGGDAVAERLREAEAASATCHDSDDRDDAVDADVDGAR